MFCQSVSHSLERVSPNCVFHENLPNVVQKISVSLSRGDPRTTLLVTHKSFLVSTLHSWANHFSTIVRWIARQPESQGESPELDIVCIVFSDGTLYFQLSPLWWTNIEELWHPHPEKLMIRIHKNPEICQISTACATGCCERVPLTMLHWYCKHFHLDDNDLTLIYLVVFCLQSRHALRPKV